MTLYGWGYWTQKFAEFEEAERRKEQERVAWKAILARIDDVPNRHEPDLCLSKFQEDTKEWTIQYLAEHSGRIDQQIRQIFTDGILRRKGWTGLTKFHLRTDPAAIMRRYHMEIPEDDHLEEHPEFCQETSFARECMKRFSSALSALDLKDFTPQVAAEAKQSQVETAEEAAISRLCPIQDSFDFWELSRSSSATVSGAPTPG
jgi:hypothetical protein